MTLAVPTLTIQASNPTQAILTGFDAGSTNRLYTRAVGGTFALAGTFDPDGELALGELAEGVYEAYATSVLAGEAAVNGNGIVVFRQQADTQLVQYRVVQIKREAGASVKTIFLEKVQRPIGRAPELEG